MKIDCPQCGASYAFDASTIPAEGYDAQCTACGAIFFVRPEVEAPPPEPGPAVADPSTPKLGAIPVRDSDVLGDVSAVCPQCRAVYRFPGDSVPRGGYETQCSACGASFFVSRDGGESEAWHAVRRGLPPAGPNDSTDEVLTPSRFQSAGSLLTGSGWLKSEGDSGHATEPVQDDKPENEIAWPSADPDITDLAVLSAQLGEPAESRGTTPQDDFALIHAQRRRRRWLIGGAAGTAGAVLLLVWAWLDPMPGPSDAVRATAEAQWETARVQALDDTPEAYTEALQTLRSVGAPASSWPRSTALLVAVQVFSAVEQQAWARILSHERQRLVADLEASPKKNVKATKVDAAPARQGLRARLEQVEAESAAVLEAARAMLRSAHELLRGALERHPEHPELVMVSGMIAALEGDRRQQARRLRRRGRQRAAQGVEAPGSPVAETWGLWLDAWLEPDRAPIAYRSILKAEPGFQRARMALAEQVWEQGDVVAAQALARAVLGAVPTHRGALALIARPRPTPRAATGVDTVKNPTSPPRRRTRPKRRRRR